VTSREQSFGTCCLSAWRGHHIEIPGAFACAARDAELRSLREGFKPTYSEVCLWWLPAVFAYRFPNFHAYHPPSASKELGLTEDRLRLARLPQRQPPAFFRRACRALHRQTKKPSSAAFH